MPVNQFILHATNISNISLNLILFKYLDTNSRNNIGSKKNLYRSTVRIVHVCLALKEIDKKKNRKRNLISANVGVFTLYFMCVYGSIQLVLYTIPINLGMRQFIVSLIADLGLCIITPAIVLYNAPIIRSQWSNLLAKFCI